MLNDFDVDPLAIYLFVTYLKKIFTSASSQFLAVNCELYFLVALGFADGTVNFSDCSALDSSSKL